MKKKSHDWIRAVLCLAGLGFMLCLTGCGVSFGGFRLGSREELVFSCEETLSPSVLEEAPAEEMPLEETPVLEEEQKTEQAESSAAETGTTAEGKVNINTAGLEELMTLNGVGETRAKAIIEYRNQNGSFTNAEDIMQIPGIKEGIYKKIQDQIIV